MWKQTSDPWPTHDAMPWLPWLWRFGPARVKSRLDQLSRRIYCRLARPPLEAIRFDVFGGKTPSIRQCISFAEAVPYASAGKRVQINSRLSAGRHALLLDWDGVSEERVREWLRGAGGRWHLYRTEGGYHFIASSRTVGYWELVRFHYRSGWHRNVGIHVSLYYGHGGLRVSRKRPERPDKYKLGVVGEGEEIAEVLELIACHDRAMEYFHGRRAGGGWEAGPVRPGGRPPGWPESAGPRDGRG